MQVGASILTSHKLIISVNDIRLWGNPPRFQSSLEELVAQFITKSETNFGYSSNQLEQLKFETQVG